MATEPSLGVKAGWLTLLGLMLVSCASWLVPDQNPTPIGDAETALAAAALTQNAPTPLPTTTDTPTPLTPSPTSTVTLTPIFSPTPLFSTTGTPPQSTGQDVSDLREPVITYFVAFPTEMVPGESFNLFWSAEDVSGAAIWRVGPDGEPGQTWAVEAQGEFVIEPETTGGEESYVLAITNGHVTVEKLITITVTCTATFFFEPPPLEGCPDSEPLAVPASAQLFEGGQMFWRGDTNQIIVLFNDARGRTEDNPDQPPAYLINFDTFTEELPEEDPSLIPPEGRQQPRRGFGLIWRDTPGVRDRLGWALDAETSFTMIVQPATNAAGDPILFISDRGGTAIVLLPRAIGWQIAGVAN